MGSHFTKGDEGCPELLHSNSLLKSANVEGALVTLRHRRSHAARPRPSPPQVQLTLRPAATRPATGPPLDSLWPAEASASHNFLVLDEQGRLAAGELDLARALYSSKLDERKLTKSKFFRQLSTLAGASFVSL